MCDIMDSWTYLGQFEKDEMKKLIARIFTAFLLAFGLLCASNFVLPSDSPLTNNVYADPVPDEVFGPPTLEDYETEDTDNEENREEENGENNDNSENEENTEEDNADDDATKDACQEQAGSLSWIVCPSSSIIAGATDAIYGAIEEMLVVNPISTDNDSPIYLIWQYLRNLTNIIFIICLLVVIYSQLTGLGIQNYGIKRVLPRLVISVILVNLSFIICALAVDISNVVGDSLRGTFEKLVSRHLLMLRLVKRYAISIFRIFLVPSSLVG